MNSIFSKFFMRFSSRFFMSNASQVDFGVVFFNRGTVSNKNSPRLSLLPGRGLAYYFEKFEVYLDPAGADVVCELTC